MPVSMRVGALVLVCAVAVAAVLYGYVHRGRFDSALRHHGLGASDVRLAIGQPFPALDLVTPAGARVHYSPRPGKVTFVNVFATWCPPCQAESPAYASFARTASSRNIAIVGIDRAESAQQVDAYRRALGLSFPYLIDDGDMTKHALGARAMPVTIVVDARGIVRADIAGPVTLERLNTLNQEAGQPL